MRAIPISPEGCWVIFAGFSRYARVNKNGGDCKKWVKTIDKGHLMLYFCTKLEVYALLYTTNQHKNNQWDAKWLYLDKTTEIWLNKKRKRKSKTSQT